MTYLPIKIEERYLDKSSCKEMFSDLWNELGREPTLEDIRKEDPFHLDSILHHYHTWDSFIVIGREVYRASENKLKRLEAVERNKSKQAEREKRMFVKRVIEAVNMIRRQQAEQDTRRKKPSLAELKDFGIDISLFDIYFNGFWDFAIKHLGYQPRTRKSEGSQNKADDTANNP
ncbi:MAG: hypothetical protein Q8R04_02195 [Nanoarchaeota archaeon]|nr:hypothetical protein [Nanoarchaeota archaeon]